MTPLHEQFVAEARELVLQASDDLIALERDGFESDRIDRILRSFHTLKGSAGVVRLPAMTLLLHAAEDVMIAVQNAQILASGALISDVEAGSPADTAGLKEGQIVLRLNGEAVADLPTLDKRLGAVLKQPGLLRFEVRDAGASADAAPHVVEVQPVVK